ncbi:MAG TPA: suppressor of fused domain protein, partial [Bacillota bacterium]|nr:suppressor of fused domain protein [Bacillota bacterium]
EKRNYHTFITAGMSSLPMKAPESASECKYAELMVCLPPSWEVSEEKYEVIDFDELWPVGYMKYLARFPHKNDTWLWFGHTIPNGNPAEPFADNTKLCGAILLPPIKTNYDFHQLKISEEKTVNFFAVVPLYEEEINYKLRYGYGKLLDRFDKYHVSEILDINRENTCKKSLWFL